MLTRLFHQAMHRILAESGAPATIVAALSGGMDSVVLLHLLAEHRGLLPKNAQIIAAHLNHGLRNEAKEDQEFCRRLARELGVGLTEQTCDVQQTALAENMGLEEAGRMMRYRFFHDIGGQGALVLTGHHADDQAETILMNLRRGAHRRGLSGMRELAWVPIPPGERVRVGRPLLGAEREMLHAYAVERNLTWREDASNADTVFTRNRIRHRVIPMLENILPGFRRRLLEKASHMAKEEESFTTAGRELALSHTAHEHNGRFFRVDDEARAEPERLIYALRHVVEEEMGARLPYGAVLSRLSELAENGRLGETLSLPGRLRVRRERDGLFFFFPDRLLADSYSEVVLPDPPFVVRAYGLAISAGWEEVHGLPPEEDRDNPDVEWLNPAAIRWPLRLRPPREGERFRPMGAQGSRKVQDILVDGKVPRRKRDMPRVIADYAGALWLWPLRLAHRARLPGGTLRALRLEIHELPGE